MLSLLCVAQFIFRLEESFISLDSLKLRFAHWPTLYLDMRFLLSIRCVVDRVTMLSLTRKFTGSNPDTLQSLFTLSVNGLNCLVSISSELHTKRFCASSSSIPHKALAITNGNQCKCLLCLYWFLWHIFSVVLWAQLFRYDTFAFFFLFADLSTAFLAASIEPRSITSLNFKSACCIFELFAICAENVFFFVM